MKKRKKTNLLDTAHEMAQGLYDAKVINAWVGRFNLAQ